MFFFRDWFTLKKQLYKLNSTKTFKNDFKIESLFVYCDTRFLHVLGTRQCYEFCVLWRVGRISCEIMKGSVCNYMLFTPQSSLFRKKEQTTGYIIQSLATKLFTSTALCWMILSYFEEMLETFSKLWNTSQRIISYICMLWLNMSWIEYRSLFVSTKSWREWLGRKGTKKVTNVIKNQILAERLVLSFFIWIYVKHV